MKILAVGGGSGGHVTPVVAVLRELKKADDEVEIYFWCDRKFAPHARTIMSHFDPTISVETIFSGKLRRYHNLSLWRQFLRPFTIVLPNLRDLVLVILGMVQSLYKLLRLRPDVVFTKGGFVCLPVGVAAHLLRIPLVIHDSDAHPGLTNRILSRYATAIATGAPLKYYPYPKDISHYVGIPIHEDYKIFSPHDKRMAKRSIGVDEDRPLVVVTGGGLGAKRMNDVVVTQLHEILNSSSVVLVSGAGQYDELKALTPQNNPNFQLRAFVSEGFSQLYGAADIVVARAGATTILELAATATPTILIPNAYLTGGHQMKNAKSYSDYGAVIVIKENVLKETPELLSQHIQTLLTDTVLSESMSKKFHNLAKPHAAEEMANIIKHAANKP